MMKKLVLFLVAVTAIGSAAMAQLGAPRITVKDTLIVTACLYNGTNLAIADWPAFMLIEDAVQIQIADYVYKKGNLIYQDLNSYNSSWGGHIDSYRYNATSNGKYAYMFIVKPHQDCDTDWSGKYCIDDYVFYVITKEKAAQLLRE